ncbi:MAG TPA: hypothetical protein VMR70_16805 [Flavisolibacter sp.]|nr:hypothetical protein [Flavisolibacter sp.]
MAEKDKTFEEQDHPLKNTDGAFVQVGKNGEPVIPKEANKEEPAPTQNDRTAPTEHQ